MCPPTSRERANGGGTALAARDYIKSHLERQNRYKKKKVAKRICSASELAGKEENPQRGNPFKIRGRKDRGGGGKSWERSFRQKQRGGTQITGESGKDAGKGTC